MNHERKIEGLTAAADRHLRRRTLGPLGPDSTSRQIRQCCPP
ncbi:MAG: hypothetical protein ABFE07_07715 [Armatimonadia bacterium]